jgi:excisionase family DNA binding protein
MAKKLYSLKEIAELLNKSTMTVRREISRGNLKAGKIGGEYSITRSELEEYLKQRFGEEAAKTLLNGNGNGK